jgi:type II secretory pathway pseudopilin PulG
MTTPILRVRSRSRRTIQGDTRRTSRRTSGFTLVELVVVVGIIIALLSLVLAVSTLLIQQNEARQLEAAFANLETAIQEYEQTVGRPISFQDRADPDGAWDISRSADLGVTGSVETPYDQSALTGVTCPPCSANSEPNNYRGWSKFTVRLMSLLRGTQSAEDIIARLDPSLFVPVKQANGQPLINDQALSTLIDPWGAPVAVVFPGRQWREGDSPDKLDADGTIRTYMETKMGICRNGKVLFVSAGPDGDIGCRGGACGQTGPRYEATLDNIYSYKPGTP